MLNGKNLCVTLSLLCEALLTNKKAIAQKTQRRQEDTQRKKFYFIF
jgi:hypothetical protein